MKSISVSLLVLCLPLVSAAQDRDTITPLAEVVLIESGLTRDATGLTPSSILDAGELERHGPLDLASSVNQISGVYLLAGTLNTNRITIRGIGARTPYG